MVRTIRHEGANYPVNDHWHEANSIRWPRLAAMTHAELDRERWRLLNLSNERHLTDDETAELAAVTNHFNVRNALRVLGTDAHLIHGFDGVDQLHGNLWRAPCGCEVHLVFDHHKSALLEPTEVKPHAVRFACQSHRHLADDVHALHAQVMADHQAP